MYNSKVTNGYLNTSLGVYPPQKPIARPLLMKGEKNILSPIF